MNNQSKKKLCWNCEGRVGLQEEHCKFCGVYLSPLDPDDEEDDKKTSLFAPPYRVGESKEEEQIPASPFLAQKSLAEPQMKEAIPPEVNTNIEVPSAIYPVVMPLVLLSIGTVLFLFGMALVMFSNNGVLSLQWSSDYWFIYFLIAIPTMLLGWKFLQQQD